MVHPSYSGSSSGKLGCMIRMSSWEYCSPYYDMLGQHFPCVRPQEWCKVMLQELDLAVAADDSSWPQSYLVVQATHVHEKELLRAAYLPVVNWDNFRHVVRIVGIVSRKAYPDRNPPLSTRRYKDISYVHRVSCHASRWNS